MSKPSILVIDDEHQIRKLLSITLQPNNYSVFEASTQVWGVARQNESQYLRVFIAQLRKKIESDPNRPSHIITESGIGYRFIGNPSTF